MAKIIGKEISKYTVAGKPQDYPRQYGVTQKTRLLIDMQFRHLIVFLTVQ